MRIEEETHHLQETGDGGYVVDMSAVPDVVNEAVPKGIYNAEITECEYKLSQASGRPMWAMVIVIADGEYAKRKLYNNMSFSEKALPYTKKTLASFAPELLTADFRPDAVDDYNIVGRNVRVKTKIGKNQDGEKRTEIAQILPAADATAFMGQS